jgi:hypothetical protein
MLATLETTLCLYCWLWRRQVVFECEGHAFFECPHNRAPREIFLEELPPRTRERISNTMSSNTKLILCMENHTESDWACFGRFAARVRQNRRRLKNLFEDLEKRLTNTGFERQRTRWRASGKPVCRHGVFFQTLPESGCVCMSHNQSEVEAAVWHQARLMPYIDHDLRGIATVAFDRATVRRLGQLQAEVRRLDY